MITARSGRNRTDSPAASIFLLENSIRSHTPIRTAQAMLQKSPGSVLLTIFFSSYAISGYRAYITPMEE